MATISFEAEVSTEQLLQAVEQLPPQEFAALVTRILALQAQRAHPHLTEGETELLLRINEGLPAETQRRIDTLVAKRQEETITPDELAELVTITDRAEQHDARRLLALEELARLRGLTLPSLMDTLGLPRHA
jgi:hypothetical protein